MDLYLVEFDGECFMSEWKLTYVQQRTIVNCFWGVFLDVRSVWVQMVGVLRATFNS